MDVQHGYLVSDHQIRIQNGWVSILAVCIREQAQRLMDCGGRMSCGLFHTPGGTSCWRAADDRAGRIGFFIELQNKPLNHGLTGARPPCNDADGRMQTGFYSHPLLRSKGYAQHTLHTDNLSIQVGSKVDAALADAFPYAHGDLLFRLGGRVTIDLVLVYGDLFAIEELLAAKPNQLFLDLGRFKQLHAFLHQHSLWNAEIACVFEKISTRFRFLEHMEQRRVYAFFPAWIKPHAFRDHIGGFESDPPHLTEPVWMLTDDVSRFPTIDFEELDGALRRNPKGGQQCDDVPRAPHFHVGFRDALQLLWTDASHFQQPMGFPVQDIQRFIAEMGINALGCLFPDAFDIARAEIGDDTRLCRLYHLRKLRYGVLVAVLTALPMPLYIIADALFGGQKVSNCLDLPQCLAGAVQYFLVGRVYCHHEPCRVGI